MPGKGYILAGVIVALGLAYFTGTRVGAHREKVAAEAQLVKTMQAMADQAAAQAKADAAAAAQHETKQEKIRVVYQTLTKEVKVYAESHDLGHCGIDADGLRLWNAANQGPAADPTGELHGALPGSAGGGLWDLARLSGEPPAGGGAVSPMPRTPSGAE